MLPVRVFYFNVVTKSAPYESPQSIRSSWLHWDRAERVACVTGGVPRRAGRAQKSSRWYRDREPSVEGINRGHMVPLMLQRASVWHALNSYESFLERPRTAKHIL
eukprot:7391937-Prymnesium_polylepis.3